MAAMEPQTKKLYTLMTAGQADASAQGKKAKKLGEGFNDTLVVVSLADSTVVPVPFSCSNRQDLERAEKGARKIVQLCPGQGVAEAARGYLAALDSGPRDKRNLCRFAVATNDGHLVYLNASQPDLRGGQFMV